VNDSISTPTPQQVPPPPVKPSGQQITDIDSLIESFRTMTAEGIVARGFTVEGTFDYPRHLPTRGQMRFFDRSWYIRAGVERVMGYCTPDEYEEFLRSVPQFEEMLMNADTTLVKLWFSVSRREQIARFTIRRIDPVRRWKPSATDIASLDRWDDYAHAKLTMFERTSTERAPWNIVRSNDKKRGRINAMRHVLNVLP